jgi:hypothetical protein
MSSICNKIEATKRKLEFWCSCVEKGQLTYLLTYFPNLTNFLSEGNINTDDEVNNYIMCHTCGPQTTFNKYFPPGTENSDWICNPINSRAPDFSSKDMEQYTAVFKVGIFSDFIKFWVKVQCDLPDIKQQTLLKILPFITTYLCENGFSSYVSTKTK